MLDQRGAAFDPVAVIAVERAIDIAHLGAVDMPADHALVTPAARFAGDGDFKIRHVVQCAFYFLLEVGRQGPVGQTHAGAQTVQVTVQFECEFIEVVAHIGQPLGALHNGIEIITVNNPQIAAIGRGVDGFLDDFDATELVADKFTRKLIMVAGHIDNAAAFAGAPQQLLHHVVVRLRPVPFAPQLPAVHNVADQVEVVAGVGFEKVQQRSRLAAGCAQVQVGNEYAAVTPAQRRVVILVVRFRRAAMVQRAQPVKQRSHQSARVEKCLR